MLPKNKKPKRPACRKYRLSEERNGALHELQRYKVELEMTSTGYNRCITCGKIVDNAQGGHFISRTCRATELEEDNINAQCPRCNLIEYGRQMTYKNALVDKIGYERVERLLLMYSAWLGSDKAFEELSPEDQQKVSHKKTAYEYHEIRMKYKRLRRELKDKGGW